MQFQVSPAVVLPEPRVVINVFVPLATEVLFPPNFKSELLYHQYSTVRVVFSASEGVALHSILKAVSPGSGLNIGAEIVGPRFTIVTAAEL